MKIKHNIPLQIQSTSSNCVQTSTSQFLGFYNVQIIPGDIEKEIPVRVDEKGRPMGTLFADIGTWIIKSQNLKVKMYVFDTQIVDRSWKSFSQSQLLVEMEKLRKTGVSTARTPYAPILIEAYVKFLQAGGEVKIEKCTDELLQTLLTQGPVMAVVSYNYMYDYPRCRYDQDKKEYVVDPSGGKVIEHAIVLTGFEDDSYLYNDPDSEMGGQLKVKADVLIGAICSAQINSINYLLSVEV